MKKIGITGGIGVGKSVVCRIFAALSVPIYDADSAAKRLMNQDDKLKQAIKEVFGQAAYDKEGLFDRDFMTKQLLGNPATAKQLEALVHPAVGRDFDNFVNTCAKQVPPALYLLKEAALLYESGSYKTLDKIIVVTASLSTRITRVLERDKHRTQAQVEAIIAKQMPDAEKIQKADFVIDNDGKILLIPQVLAIHKALVLPNLF
jgi:dephospho-CoA kinase